MRLLNRSAQRYLLHGDGDQPAIGIPGSAIDETTMWQVPGADLPGAALLTLDGRGVQSSASEVHLAHSPDARWRVVEAGDGYHHVVAADDPGRMLGAANAGDGQFLPTISSRVDRSTMWLLAEDCVRDARSVHLRYRTPDQFAMFYSEVYPAESPPGTFFCTSGFGANARRIAPSGYAGIQERPDGTRRAIFSVWHRMANEVDPVPGSEAVVVGAHRNADSTTFSGEGSGASVRLAFDWPRDRNIPTRFVVTAEVLGSGTLVSCYVSQGPSGWINLGVIHRAETGGGLLSRPYAFIEDFLRNGARPGVRSALRSPYRRRSATFGNPWTADTRGRLAPVEEVSVTVFSPHPLESLAASATESVPFGINLATGTENAITAPPIGRTFTHPGDRQHRSLAGIPSL